MKSYRRAPRPPLLQECWSDIQIVEKGGCKVLARPSNDTASAVAYDYSLIEWQLRQVQILKEQNRSAARSYGLAEVRQDFAGERILDFADDCDLEAALEFQKIAPIASRMIARVTGLDLGTVLQYAKRPRIKGKNQRSLIRAGLPRR